MNLSQFTKAEIDEAIQNVEIDFGKIQGIDMKRMQLQIKYAKECLYAFHSGFDNIIISAPTGFGKSLLAFFISKVFNYLHKSTTDEKNELNLNDSYILTANKFLQKQYRKDVKAFNFTDNKMLQGQSNYTCHVNGKPFTERPCSEESISSLVAGTTSYKCVPQCTYLNERIAAINASSTILNYHYWLTTMNYVLAVNQNAPFQIRNLTIFDECHVLGNIVQEMFTSEININAYVRRTLSLFMSLSNRIGVQSDYTFETFAKLIEHVESMCMDEDNNVFLLKELEKLIDEFVHFKKEYSQKCRILLDSLPLNAQGKPIKSSEDETLFKYLKTMIDDIESLCSLKVIIETFGSETLVFQHEDTNDMTNKPIEILGKWSSKKIKFQCTHEAELVKKAVHQWTKYTIFMSATIGDADTWADQTGLENYHVIEVPQVFDYTKSTISSVLPMISMSYKNKHLNMKTMMHRIQHIIDNHPNENGIVHAGNYQITKEIEKLNHPRIVTYTKSSEKDELLHLLKNNKGIVVVGPSLIEGVDLKDDMCRFMIWAKVPYMSLSDKLTKRKMEIYKGWYNWVTLMSFLQGLGRGIRNDKDWCKTYILDDSFTSFFTRVKLPSWVKSRMNMVEYDKLNDVYDPDAELNDMLDMLK